MDFHPVALALQETTHKITQQSNKTRDTINTIHRMKIQQLQLRHSLLS
jgi:hypothetical protein